METKIWLFNICKENHLPVDNVKLDLMDQYVQALRDWNQKINLISRNDEPRVWSRHILGSIMFLSHLRPSPHSLVLDLGTGGGLPGIPLAILCSDIHMTLVDSIQKKVSAVSDIIRNIGLNNAIVLAGRAEDLSKRKDLQQSFDYVISRAVGPMDRIVRWAKPFLKVSDTMADQREESTNLGHKVIPKGSVILLKGGDVSDEINTLRIKMKPRSVCSYPITIQGDIQTEFIDKKIVLIQP